MKKEIEQLKEKLKELILTNTEYWQPYGKCDEKRRTCFIIEEMEPFFWRINPEWAGELAQKILELFEEENKKLLKEIDDLKMQFMEKEEYDF